MFYICQGWRNFHLNIQSINQTKDLLYHQLLIWHKMWPVFGRTDYSKDFEVIIYGWKVGDKHRFNLTKGGDVDIWQIKKDSPQNYMHLTQKPLEVPMRAITNSSADGDLVLDLFGGSGSTLIACEKLGRRCVAFELDRKYASVIVDRWERFTNRRAVINGKKR